MRFQRSLSSIACCLGLTAVVTAAATGDLRLITAIRTGQVAQIHALLVGRVDVNARAGDGATALHWAVHRDDLSTTDSLLRAGASVNAVTDTGVTPLYLACTNGDAAIVGRLLRAGANANMALLNGETALMECSRTGNVDAAGLLLSAGANPNAHESSHQQTPLMWAVANRHPHITQLLIAHGADIRARSASYTQTVTGGSNATARVEGNFVVNKGGSTPLLFAARVGDAESAALLVAAGADVNDRLPDGTSALVLAAHSGQADAAIVLLDHGADPKDAAAGYNALHAAVLRGDGRLVKALLEHHADPNATIRKGMPLRRTSQDFELPEALVGATPYFLAAKFLEPEIMRTLIDGGANPQLTSRDGSTALMAAAGIGAPAQANRRGLSLLDGAKVEDAARILQTVSTDVAAGGNVNAVNNAGDTALHGAASQGYDAVVQLLVDHGADVNAKNKRGQTPLAALTGGRRNRAATANAFVNTYSETSHPSTAALLRKLGATE
jgi:ankyrin repeat protein